MNTVRYLKSSDRLLALKHVNLRFKELHAKLLRPSRPPMYVAQTNLLILGAARSGTTLLAAMLASHSQVGVLFEDLWGGAGRILAKRYKGVKLCVPNQIELQHRWSILDLVLARIPKLNTMPPLFRTATSKYSIADYLQNDELKVVAIIRDINSVTSSRLKRTKRTNEVAMSEWSRAVEVIHALYGDHKGRMIVVRFNSLVQAPEQTSKALCEFLGLDFEQSMLQAHKHTPIYQTDKIDASKAVASETITISDDTIRRQYEALLRESI
jgi:Sulfotransferase domain